MCCRCVCVCMTTCVCMCVCVYVCKIKKLMTQWHSDQPTCKGSLLSYFVHIGLFVSNIITL